MPELLEVEMYREAAERVVGRRIGGVDAPDAWYLKGGVSARMLADVLVGSVVVAARRRGKLLMLDTDRREVLGLRFGMTGRLLVTLAATPGATDGVTHDPVGRLEYAPAVDRPGWQRFAVGFTDGARLVLTDPRRLGGVELNPPEARLGPEASTVTAAELDRALADSSAPLKAVLMNQARLAGLGNLLTDEVLWRARLSPQRPAAGLSAGERGHLVGVIRATVAELGTRGGSHTGDLQPARERGGHCPRCGVPLRRDDVGGRTTYWCPGEQG